MVAHRTVTLEMGPRIGARFKLVGVRGFGLGPGKFLHHGVYNRNGCDTCKDPVHFRVKRCRRNEAPRKQNVESGDEILTFGIGQYRGPAWGTIDTFPYLRIIDAGRRQIFGMLCVAQNGFGLLNSLELGGTQQSQRLVFVVPGEAPNARQVGVVDSSNDWHPLERIED